MFRFKLHIIRRTDFKSSAKAPKLSFGHIQKNFRANFKRPAGSIEFLFGICRKSVFGGYTFPAVYSNYSRQLREDSFQIFPPMTFEISSSVPNEKRYPIQNQLFPQQNRIKFFLFI